MSVLYERKGDAAMSVIWIAIAFWPARVASRKGHSFIGYFIFSLVFFPAALLVAYLVPDRTQVDRTQLPGGSTTAGSQSGRPDVVPVIE